MIGANTTLLGPESAIACPEPGIYHDVPHDEYIAWTAASNSQLGRLVPPATPAHLKAYLDEPPPTTRAFREGRVLHACVLEQELYQRAYSLAEQCHAITKDGRGPRCSKEGSWPLKDGDGLSWLCTTHLQQAENGKGDFAGLVIDPDIVVLKPADDEIARAVRSAVRGHPTAGAFLKAKDAQTEVSIVWDDVETGVRCKARWDWYSPSLGGGTVMDLKGARDASPPGFRKDGFRFGYHRQGTLYLWGAKALEVPVAHYVMVAVEKKPPYALTLHRMTESTVGHLPGPGEDAHHCARQIRALLRLWDKCRSTGEYPGYTDDVQDFALEEWQWSELDRQTRIIEELAA